MSAVAEPTVSSGRIEWLGILRGICSLWIVYYHLYTPFATGTGGRLPPLDANWLNALVERYQGFGHGFWSSVLAAKHDVIATMSLHAVGIFILLSGFGLAASLLRRGHDAPSWSGWYRARFFRLYPFLWFAHILFLVVPFVWRPEPVDFRFLISLTGVRAWPMDTLFFYANPSWWFFWLIIQLYAVFPLLWLLLTRTSPAVFLSVTVGLSLLSRYWLLFHCQSGDVGYLLTGGIFLPRLGEFAMGMALARFAHARSATVFSFFRRNIVTFSGVAIYALGFWCYSHLATYVFVDLVATLGLFLLASRVAILLAKIPIVARWLAFAGSVSLSTFLLHQPWTITAGLALHGRPVWVFALAVVVLLPLMVFLAWLAENFVRRFIEMLRPPVRPAPPPVAAAPA